MSESGKKISGSPDGADRRGTKPDRRAINRMTGYNDRRKSKTKSGLTPAGENAAQFKEARDINKMAGNQYVKVIPRGSKGWTDK